MGDVSVLKSVSGPSLSNRLGPEDLQAALRLMVRIRRFETRAKELFLADADITMLPGNLRST